MPNLRLSAYRLTTGVNITVMYFFAEQCMDDLIKTTTEINSSPISVDIKLKFIRYFILPLDFR
jgi:hypothetical protein